MIPDCCAIFRLLVIWYIAATRGLVDYESSNCFSNKGFIDYEPDIIWMNESPENYEYRQPLVEVTEIIYSKDRKHKIIETTHNNAFDFNQKIFIPDEFLFCSNKHIKDSDGMP